MYSIELIKSRKRTKILKKYENNQEMLLISKVGSEEDSNPRVGLNVRQSTDTPLFRRELSRTISNTDVSDVFGSQACGRIRRRRQSSFEPSPKKMKNNVL